MLVLLGVLSLACLVSLLPFLYPETVMNTLGVFLNHLWGQFLVAVPGLEATSLVAKQDGVYGLTLQGVFAVYGIPLGTILFVLRGR